MKRTRSSSTPPNTSVPRAPITVLVADDHPVVREGVVNMVRQQPDLKVVAEAADGPEALAAWMLHRPDVALLDLRMPKLDGPAVIAKIREQDPQARTIILTTYENEQDVFRAMQAGARAYLLKDVPRTELLDCIRRVSTGEFCLSADLAKRLAANVGLPELTPREREVLQLAGRGSSNREIALMLTVRDSTVKSHMKSIFAKLDALSRTEAVSIAQRRGLIEM